ncbi:unnamed protein product [Rangifer tarandus platyrhynchus]|uniref:Uncharacterized protein n=2 Tax=Rangifer tarandus platyrhynchus TaxID=3082113 RepID=A0ABN8YK92_RANTA|nr:unnamed protein product [Rangifer tarandus platyrhynchus]
MAPICGFVVFPLRGGKKTGSYFFFPWITVSVRSRLLFRIILLFLLSSGVSLAYLTAFFLSVEAPEETVHWQFSADSCGDSSSVSFEDDQRALRHCHVQQGAAWFGKDHGHCPASPPLCLLARD